MAVYTGRVGVHRHVYIHMAGVTLWFRLIKLCLAGPKGRRVARADKGGWHGRCRTWQHVPSLVSLEPTANTYRVIENNRTIFDFLNPIAVGHLWQGRTPENSGKFNGFLGTGCNFGGVHFLRSVSVDLCGEIEAP